MMREAQKVTRRRLLEKEKTKGLEDENRGNEEAGEHQDVNHQSMVRIA
jgi:hypothetical protein